jgi:hypothetical protein
VTYVCRAKTIWAYDPLNFASNDPARSFCMSSTATLAPDAFIDRRTADYPNAAPNIERRQFANSYDELSPEAAELARAIDGYKVQHRRRFITFEEMLSVMKSLGYKR